MVTVDQRTRFSVLTGDDDGIRREVPSGHPVVAFSYPLVKLVSQAEVQGDLGRQLPVILKVVGHFKLARMARRIAQTDRGLIGKPEQKVRECEPGVAGPIDGIEVNGRRAARVKVKEIAPKIRAEFHGVKFGADFRRYLFNFYTGGPPSINFNSVNRPGHTGFAFADFLLGLPDQTSIGLGDPAGHPRKFEMAYYFQNDWKLTPKITLNLGLRYEFYKRITERDNRMSGWDLATNSVIIAGQNGETSSLVHR